MSVTFGYLRLHSAYSFTIYKIKSGFLLTSVDSAWLVMHSPQLGLLRQIAEKVATHNQEGQSEDVL